MLNQVNTQVNSSLFYHKIVSSLVNHLSILTLLMIWDVCNFSMIFCNHELQLILIGVKFIKLFPDEFKNYLSQIAVD